MFLFRESEMKSTFKSAAINKELLPITTFLKAEERQSMNRMTLPKHGLYTDKTISTLVQFFVLTDIPRTATCTSMEKCSTVRICVHKNNDSLTYIQEPPCVLFLRLQCVTNL
ncbi:hypothetical protein WA026_014860 [Henosepilachna vigintioctopunctata]|uniref:Uncharacterized protein n=1 Tax=Henosepilachna vigintioctopunctata TaxID=420089 RepID=A0AAW1UUB1_9CUCU